MQAIQSVSYDQLITWFMYINL